MKNNKKGFTLIELLAVIAILAILVVIAVPAVLNLFNDAKRNSFVTQTQQLYNAAEQQMLTNQINPGASQDVYCYIPDSFNAGESIADEIASSMSLEGTKNVAYKIVFSAVSGGKTITSITVVNKDNTIQVNDAAGVNISDIDNTKIKTTGDLPTSCAATWSPGV